MSRMGNRAGCLLGWSRSVPDEPVPVSNGGYVDGVPGVSGVSGVLVVPSVHGGVHGVLDVPASNGGELEVDENEGRPRINTDPPPAITESIVLYGVNKFLASGKSTNSDWGRAPIRLDPTVEKQVLDHGRISDLLELFKSQPWILRGTRTTDSWQNDAMEACKFAIRNAELTGFIVNIQGKDVKNYLAVGPGRSILLCWEGSWTDRSGREHPEIMYQAVVPYLDGLSKSEILREFLNKYANAASRRVMLPEWDRTHSVQFRQACKAIWNLFPDLSPIVGYASLEHDVTCTICLQDLEQGTKYGSTNMDDWAANSGLGVKTACGHYYHASCLDAWLAKRVSCPVCRQRPY